MAISKKNAFSRRLPDLVTEELVAVLSQKRDFEFKALFEFVHANLRARNAASGGEEMLRLRAYEKLQNLVSRGLVKKTLKEYRGMPNIHQALPQPMPPVVPNAAPVPTIAAVEPEPEPAAVAVAVEKVEQLVEVALTKSISKAAPKAKAAKAKTVAPKKAAAKAAKPAPAKKAVKAAKPAKPAPAKKAAVKTPAKPAAKKVVAKKVAAKPAPKKAKPAAKPVAKKPAAKPAAKKAPVKAKKSGRK